MDLVPTIYELCGYQVTPPLQGRSLLPLLRGKTTKHRDHVIEIELVRRQWSARVVAVGPPLDSALVNQFPILIGLIVL